MRRPQISNLITRQNLKLKMKIKKTGLLWAMKQPKSKELLKFRRKKKRENKRKERRKKEERNKRKKRKE